MTESSAPAGTEVTRDGLVEACVFVSETPVSDKKIAAAMGCTVKEVRDSLKHLRERYDAAAGALELIEIAEGWRFATRPRYEPHLNKLFGVRRVQRLSRAALEVLSIVAYNQPVTGQEVQQIRGIDSYAVLKGLSEQGYIRIAGRKDAPGSPLLYATTPAFLEYFGLKDLSELPDERELDQMFQGPIEQVVMPLEEDAPADSAPSLAPGGSGSGSAGGAPAVPA